MARKLKPRGRPARDDAFRATQERDEEADEKLWTHIEAEIEADSNVEAANEAENEAEEEEDADETPARMPRRETGQPPSKIRSKSVELVLPTVRQTVDLTKSRKLSKAQKATLTKRWSGENRQRSLDSFFSRQVEEARKQHGHRGVFLGKEAQALVIGIPMFAGHGADAGKYPGCLPMEFVITQDVYPLGLVVQIVALYGVGKCLGRGTPVMKTDGSVIPVEAVALGDRLMGPDGKARTVRAVTRGCGPLYRVDPIKGEPWVCNDAHMLTVVHSRTNEVTDVPAVAWANATPSYQQRSKLFSVGVDSFEGTAEAPLPIDPYFLGVWFGDGTKGLIENGSSEWNLRCVRVTKPDKQIRKICESVASAWGLRLRVEGMTYCLVSDEPGGLQNARVNRLLIKMRELLTDKLIIPSSYLRASRHDRLQFLAGFLDTDAELCNKCFVISQKRRDWAEAIWWLARSLGFCSTKSKRQASCTRKDGSKFIGSYYVVTISGDTDQIPTRIRRKRAKPRRQRKTATRTGFTLTALGEGEYFGFALDGDGRFLLGDFTVTHNSALLAEINRWFDLAGGGSELNENETKFNPDWYTSIMREAYGRMPLHRCTSVEDWQRHMTGSINRLKHAMDGTRKEPGPGRIIPVNLGVDSIMGKQSEETQEKILGKRLENDPEKRGTTGKGFASRGWAIEAQSITRYMRTVPAELDGWPFAITLINHLRLKTDEDTKQELRNKTGGEQVNFQESFELELRKLGGHKKMIQGLEFDGVPLEISCEKNSFGPGHRKIQTRLLWWEEEDESSPGGWSQRTIWDWDWATIHLLDNLLSGPRASPRIRQSLKVLGFHLEIVERGDIENLAWSESVGMKSRKEALPWHELGAAIRADGKLMDALRKALRIRQRPWLAGDYLKQMNTLAAKMA